MLTISDVTWQQEEFSAKEPEAVHFESLYVPVKPIFIKNDGTKKEVLSLKYYTIQFEKKSLSVCLAQYINDHGQIDQAIINGTGHEHLHLSGCEYSGISY